MSKNSKRARLSAVPYRMFDRVRITERYRGAVGEKIHGRVGTVAKVSYGSKDRPGKFVWVQLDGEPDTSLVLTFADELDREPTTQEQLVAAWAEDPEGKTLVQAILDRKEQLVAAVAEDPEGKPQIVVYTAPRKEAAK